MPPLILKNCALFFFLFSYCFSTVCAQNRAPYLNWAIYDAPNILGRVDGQTILEGAIVIGFVSALSSMDSPIQQHAEGDISSFWRHYADATNYLDSRELVISSALGIFGLSLLTDSYVLQDAAFTSAQALLYASTTTLALKYIFGRHRPTNASTPFHFSPFSGNTSFPSGHATAAFALLIPWAMYYSKPVVWGLVVLAGGGTAFARIVNNKHWFTDVMAGSTIGFLAGYLLSRKHQAWRSEEKFATTTVDFTPVLTPDMQGAQLVVRF